MDVHVAPLPKLQEVMGAHVLLVSPVSSHFYSPHLLSVTACQGWWQSVLLSDVCLNQSFPAVLWVDPVGSGAHSNSVVTLLPPPFPSPLLSFQQELLTLQSHLPDCLDKLSKLCVLVSHPYLGSEARTKERDCTVGKKYVDTKPVNI